METQQIDHRVFGVGRSDGDCLIGDIAVATVFADGGNAQRIILIAFGKIDDRFRNGRREHQCPALLTGSIENFFKIFAETHVEHFVRFIENRCTQIFEVERSAFQVIAQTARRSNDDMRAAAQLTPFLGSIHAANAGRDLRACWLIEPCQFATHLQRKLAGRCDDQSQWFDQKRETTVVIEQLWCHRQTEGYGLAGAGLGGYDKVAAIRFWFKHSGLNRRRLVIFVRRKRLSEKR